MLGSHAVHLAAVAEDEVVEGVSFGVPYHGVWDVETVCHALLRPFRGHPAVLMKEGTPVNCSRCRRSIG